MYLESPKEGNSGREVRCLIWRVSVPSPGCPVTPPSLRSLTARSNHRQLRSRKQEAGERADPRLQCCGSLTRVSLGFPAACSANTPLCPVALHSPMHYPAPQLLAKPCLASMQVHWYHGRNITFHLLTMSAASVFTQGVARFLKVPA